MGAEVYFWFMVVSFDQYDGGVTTMPVPYQTEEMCRWALDEANITGTCIPQPAADVAEFSATWAMPRADVCEVGALTTKP